MRVDERRALTVLVVVGLVAVVLLAWWRVPWDPVPGGALPTLSPRTYFRPAELARADDYARWTRVWSYASLVVSLAVAAALGLTRVGRALTERLRGPWWLRAVCAVAVVLLAGRLATLPFGLVLHHRQRDAGLATQGVEAYLLDVIRGELVAVVATSIGVLALLSCVRRLPRAWPVVAAGVLGVLVMAGSYAYPVLVEPLFNDFTPLPAGDLRTRVLALADAEGVSVDDVLVADASRRTTTLNAYVSGYGDTRRVVLYDNLVDDEPEAVTLSVVAHELAHAKHDDVLTGSLLGAAGAVVAVGALGLLVGRRRGGLGDPAVVPLLLALVALGSFALSPVENAVSRRIETRADVDALRTTRDPAAFVQLQQELAVRALADPTPPALTQWWFGSHPTTMQRIALADRTR